MFSLESDGSSSSSMSLPEIEVGDLLRGSSTSYSVLGFLSEGPFSRVAKCRNTSTKEAVAVKILKKREEPEVAEKEASILKALGVMDPARTNVVQFYETFYHDGKFCLVFELLDQDLYRLLEHRGLKPLSVSEIRPLAQQLLAALEALGLLGILHADIKPDNVMVVCRHDRPLRVKLIDFGMAIFTSEVEVGMESQSLGFRAPEVALGLPVTETIDVWGVGCVLALLYLADNLFSVDCDYQMMKSVVEMMGQPEDHLLRGGEYTDIFFCESKGDEGPTWRRLSAEEYFAVNDLKPKEGARGFEQPSSLDDLVHLHPHGDATELEDRKAFVDLLKQLLHVDGTQRISAHQALQHRFFSGAQQSADSDNGSYLFTSSLMDLCSGKESRSAEDRLKTIIPVRKVMRRIYGMFLKIKSEFFSCIRSQDEDL